MITRLGVDVGFGDVKAALIAGDELRLETFPAILGRPEHIAGGGLAILGKRRARGTRVTYGGLTYVVGDAALRDSRTLAARQDRQRVGSDEERILMLVALARLGVSRAAIVTGLPVDWFADARKIRRSWEGTHQLTYGRQELAIEVVQVRVIWQPAGTVYAHFLDNAGRPTVSDQEMLRPRAVIDVGMNTTDLSGFDEDQKPAPWWSGSAPTGVRKILSMVGDEIRREYDMALSIHQVQKAIGRGYVEPYGQRRYVNGLLSSARAAVAAEIVGVASEKWGNGAQFADVLITGGGAAYVGRDLARVYSRNARILTNPGTANAIGFARFAQLPIFSRLRG